MANYDENKKFADSTPEDIANIIDEIAKKHDPKIESDAKLLSSLLEKMCKGECAIRVSPPSWTAMTRARPSMPLNATSP